MAGAAMTTRRKIEMFTMMRFCVASFLCLLLMPLSAIAQAEPVAEQETSPIPRLAALTYVTARQPATTDALLVAARFNQVLFAKPEIGLAQLAEAVAGLRVRLADSPVAWADGGHASVAHAELDPVGLLLRERQTSVVSDPIDAVRYLSALLALSTEPGAEPLKRPLAAALRLAAVQSSGWVWKQLIDQVQRRPELKPLADEILASVTPKVRVPGSDSTQTELGEGPPEEIFIGASEWLAALGLVPRRDLDVSTARSRTDRLDEPLGMLAVELRALSEREYQSLNPDGVEAFQHRHARAQMRRFLLQPDSVPRANDAGAIALECAQRAVFFSASEEIELLFCLDTLDVVLSTEAHASALPGAVSMLSKAVSAYAEDRSSVMEGIDTRLSRRLRSLATTFGSGVADRAATGSVAEVGAQLGLLADSLDGYLDQPFRETLENELAVCMRFGRRQGMGPPAPISDIQFNGCLNSFEQWAVRGAVRPETSGDSDGPFGAVQLDRELELPAWQRVNYLRGYLAQHVDGCQAPRTQFLNPIEWSVGARSWADFAEAWPMKAAQVGVAAVRRMGVAGLDLVAELAQPCDRDDGMMRVINASLENYRRGVAAFAQALEARRAQFRAQILAPGADVDFNAGSDQVSKYRPEDLGVGPCQQAPICGVSSEFSASRALFGLFPNPYLLADQTRMGKISLCYDNVRWVDRRQTPSTINDPKLATYFGRLSFELRGYYQAGEERELVFARRLTSQAEHEYLMGDSSESVLRNPCPNSLIGTSVVSELPEGRFDLVPRRLTYLTAARTDPARLFAENWDQGEEWRDQFISEERVDVLLGPEFEPLKDRISERLTNLKRQQDRELYAAMLGGMGIELAEDRVLRDATLELTVAKSLVARLSRIYLSRSVVMNEAIRATLYGGSPLMDRAGIAIHRGLGGDPLALADIMRRRTEDALEVWLPHLAMVNPPELDPLLVNTLVDLKAYRVPVIPAPAAPEPEEPEAELSGVSDALR